jgi:rRNA processing protein Krr1/Pno1
MSVSDLLATICPTFNWKCGNLSSAVTLLLMMKSPKKAVPPTKGRNIGNGGRNPDTLRALMEVYMVIVDYCVR